MVLQCIVDLDNALVQAGEDVVLRRTAGLGTSRAVIDVKCRAFVRAVAVHEIAPGIVPSVPAGVVRTDQTVIISPTQIRNAKWPGGTVLGQPPLDEDPSIPRIDDQMFVQKRLRTVSMVDVKFIGDVWVRADIRVTG